MCDSGSSFGASWWALGTFSAPVARPEPIATGSPMNFTCSDLQRVSFERRSPARDLHVSGVDRPTDPIKQPTRRTTSRLATMFVAPSDVAFADHLPGILSVSSAPRRPAFDELMAAGR
jgi:hypothetical protein